MERKSRRRLGWLLAGVLVVMLSLVLSLFVSSQAWALDLDSEIRKQNTESAQILNTLGRNRKTSTTKDKSGKNDVNLRLIRKTT